MEVMPGYKETEVGIIPEDWDIEALANVCKPHGIVRGPFGGALKKEIFVADGFKVYEQRNAIYKSWELGSYFIDQPKYAEMHRFSISPGDFIISCSGTIGRIYQLPDDAPKGVINQALLKLTTCEDVVNDRYFYVLFESDEFQARIVDSSQGGAMKNLVGMDVFRTTAVVLPPLPEQRAIATALSDVDALLGGLDRLVAKKRDLKQAAMQQLLTGQTRLPGFHGEWETKRLGDVGTFLKGSGVKKDETKSGDLPCVRYGEIYTHHNDYIRSLDSWISPEVAVTATRLEEGDLLFAGSGETKEEIGKCVAFIGNHEAFAGGDIVILRAAGANPMFMGYYCNTAPINAQKASKGQGDAVVHISAAALSSIVVTLPALPEQTAIAAVLSDMDAELAALGARRDKTRDLKQAMTQELLTGKTRLVPAGAPHV